MELTATIQVYSLAATIQAASMTASMLPGGFTANVAPASFTANISAYNITAEVTAGIQGEPGSKAEEIIATAGENISALRVVRGKVGGVFVADSSDMLDADMIIGITTTSALAGASINVRAFGNLQDSSWNWNLINPIFFDADGKLAQTVPAVGFAQQVATPATSTSININIKNAIKLA